MEKLIWIALLFFLGTRPHSAQAEPHHPSTADTGGVQYYSTIRFVETPLSPLQGSIPLTEEVALTRNHYRFTYNENNELVSVTFFNGDTPRAPNHTANLFTLAHRMEFAAAQTTETITFYNEFGNRIPVLGDCDRFVYTKNELGYRNSLYFLDQSGQRIENSWGIYRYGWSYQNDGTVIEDRFDAAGKPVSIRPGFEFYRLRLYFNHRGHIALMQNIDANGNLVENSSGAAQDRIVTNAQGNFLEWHVLDSQGELERGNGPDIAIGLQEFDAFGYETALESRDENNQPITSAYGICRSKTSFDRFGNLHERRFYDAAGDPAPHARAGYHRLVLAWDPTGNYRQYLRYYAVNGQPVLHVERGYHAVRYEYDTDQRLTKISYFDTDGEPVDRKDTGAAVVRLTYDTRGVREDAIAYDKAGREVR